MISAEQLRSGNLNQNYTRQLFTASKGYDRAAIDQFQDF
jgi:peptide/nickel transport system ATP-binding protein